MQIAVLSDIHDNVWSLAAVLEQIQTADMLICCGDLCSPFIVTQLGEGFAGRPIHVVFGNNDADLFRITRNAARFPKVQIHGAFYADTFDGRTLAVNHYDDIALAIARGQTVDVVCYGHNHDFKIEPIGRTLTINPGAVMGYNPIQRTDVPCTFVIYDTVTHLAHGYRLGAGRGELGNDRRMLAYG